MVYNGQNQRIGRIDTDGTQNLFVAGHEITVDTQNTVHAVRTYDHNGEMIATRSTDDGLTWIGTTHQGTAAWAISAATMVLTYRRQDPFGNTRGNAVNWTVTQQGFHTGTEDPTGFVSMGARFYDPATGRFISRDPIQTFTDTQQINGYSYVSNNPITKSDPTGMIETVCSPGDGNGECKGRGTTIDMGYGYDGHSKSKGCGCNSNFYEDGSVLIQSEEGDYFNGVNITDIGPLNEVIPELLELMKDQNLSDYWGTIVAIDQLCHRPGDDNNFGCEWSRENMALTHLGYCAVFQDMACDVETTTNLENGRLIKTTWGEVLDDAMAVERQMGISGGDGSHGVLKEIYTGLGVAMPAFYCAFAWYVCGVGMLGGVTFGQLASCKDPLGEGCTGSLTRAIVLSFVGAVAGKGGSWVYDKNGKK